MKTHGWNSCRADSVESMVHTPLTHLEEKYGRTIRPEEPVVAWAIRRAGWLITRFRVREDG